MEFQRTWGDGAQATLSSGPSQGILRGWLSDVTQR